MNDATERNELGLEREAQDLVAQDRRHIWHPYTQHATETERLLITRAKGASLFDAEGREILDLVSSWWTCTHGHSHPKLNEAIARQAAEFEHVMFAGFTHQPAIDLATALSRILPGDLNRVFFSDDGSTAVEVALKIAYQYWANHGDRRRRVFISFDGGYHGDTLGAMSLGRGSGFFSLFRGLMCQVAVLPFPYTFDGDEAAEDRERGALTALKDRLWNGAHDVAALIVEPLLQGAGGMRLCRPEFLARLVETAKEAGTLVIFDEVATGFGRTGTLFAMERAGVVPDLVCLSKGLTAGYMPMAVTVASERVFEAFLGDNFDRALSHGHTFTANPLACAVALRSLQLFEEEATIARIAHIEAQHREALETLKRREDVLRPRVKGSVLAFELKGEAGYQSAKSQALKSRFLAKGLNIRPLGATVYLMPPYCITEAELARAYSGLIEGLDQLRFFEG
jgi:adenosylmethionine-8-amino-7-oxononanoate aminotransferase